MQQPEQWDPALTRRVVIYVDLTAMAVLGIVAGSSIARGDESFMAMLPVIIAGAVFLIISVLLMARVYWAGVVGAALMTIGGVLALVNGITGGKVQTALLVALVLILCAGGNYRVWSHARSTETPSNSYPG